jgi:Fe-S oxidoreductase
MKVTTTLGLIPSIIFFVLAGIALFLFFRQILPLLTVIRKGKSAPHYTENPGKRIGFILIGAVFQKKMWRRILPGTLHALLFYGFLIVTTSLVDSVFHAVTGWHLPLLNSRIFAILVDLAIVIILAALVYFAIRRAFTKPYFLTITRDGWIILGAITIDVVAQLLANAYAWRAYPVEETGYYPVARRLGELLIPSQAGWPTPSEPPQAVRESAYVWWQVFWWLKVLSVLVLLVYIPMSKHFHIMTSFLSTYFQSTAPKGKLRFMGNTDAIEKKMEEEAPLGASKLEDFTWKDLLDTAACTECGRCTSVCPANQTGKPLNPKKIITDLKQTAFRETPINLISYAKGGALVSDLGAAADGGTPPPFNSSPEEVERSKQGVMELPPLVGGMTTHDELWSCTTCRACMQECPVFIEHVPKIVDMRRYLVLQENEFPKEVTGLFNNLERNSNPWQINNRERADWLKSLPEHLQHRQMAEIDEGEEVDVLFWVGCMGSLDNRNKKIVQNLALIMDEAGIKWAILGKEESCTGDPARRIGNEYLYAMLAQQNIEVIQTYQESHKIRKVVTACPHCFNTLKNEYPDFGANFEVVHHTQLIAQLVEEGKVTLDEGVDAKKITYHDPCYLGRYNDIYDAPRFVLNALGNGLKKAEFSEMPRHRDKSFCCGGGGGRAWMEEKIGTRVNRTRIKEAAETGADVVAAGCPFCITMFEDGIKGEGLEDKLKVMDITELVAIAKTKKPLPMATPQAE